MPQVSISDAEWQVMNVVWDAQPLAAQEVIARLEGEAAWAPATIKTMLHRLVAKKILTYELQGNRYEYRSRVRRQRLRAGRQPVVSGAGLRRRTGRSAGPFSAQLKTLGRRNPQLRHILDEQEARP